MKKDAKRALKCRGLRQSFSTNLNVEPESTACFIFFQVPVTSSAKSDIYDISIRLIIP